MIIVFLSHNDKKINYFIKSLHLKIINCTFVNINYKLLIHKIMKNFEKQQITFIDEKSIKNYFESNLPENYHIASINTCYTNGCSTYVKVFRGNEIKPFVFRISDHLNGNKFKTISDNDICYEVRGANIDAMLYFCGDKERTITTEIVKIKVENYGDTPLLILKYKNVTKELIDFEKISTRTTKKTKKEINTFLVTVKFTEFK